MPGATATNPKQPPSRERATRAPRGSGRAHNPFATAFTEPGSLPWLDDGGANLNSLATRALATGRPRRWQIRGPRGSGKTTLLVHLARHITRTSGRPAQLVRKPWAELIEPGALAAAPSALLIDSYDSLPLYLRFRAGAIARRARATLVVTTHRPLPGFRTLHRRRVDADLAHRLTHALLPAGAPAPSERELARWLAERETMRNVLCRLYDAWEAGGPQTAQPIAQPKADAVKDAPVVSRSHVHALPRFDS